MTGSRGFTLLELLIAIAIFALTGAMAYTGLQQVLDQQHDTEAASQRLAAVQKAYAVMQRDLEQLVRRGIRNEFGDSVGALVGGSGYTGVEFSRTGYANPAGFVRSDIQRVAYIPDQDTLLRRTWRVLDRAQDSLPDEQVLVSGMRRLNLRFLDQGGNWLDAWPPPQTQTGGTAPPDELPRAIEVQLELDGMGTLQWLFTLPDNPVISVQQVVGGASGDDTAGDGGSPPADAGAQPQGEQGAEP